MKQDVFITVTGVHSSPDSGENSIEIQVPGQYSHTGQNHFLIYEEIDEDTSQTTRNLVRFRDGFMEVTKSGLINSHMLFEDGKEFVTPYRTPFGQILAEFKTSRVRVSQGSTVLTADVSYELDLDDAYCADCRLQISIRFPAGF